MQRGLRKQAMEMRKALDILKEAERKPDAPESEEMEKAELFLYTEVRCVEIATTHAIWEPYPCMPAATLVCLGRQQRHAANTRLVALPHLN